MFLFTFHIVQLEECMIVSYSLYPRSLCALYKLIKEARSKLVKEAMSKLNPVQSSINSQT